MLTNQLTKIKVIDEDGRYAEVDVDSKRLRYINAHMQHVFAGDDSAAVAFYTSQLTYLESRVYEKYYRPMQGQLLMPISSAPGPAAQSVTYQVIESFGEANDASPSSNEVPYTDVAMSQVVREIRHGLIGYKYTQQEMRTAALLKQPLDGLRMKAAMDTYLRRISEVALIGRAKYGVYGLFNQPSNIITPVVAGSVAWDDASVTADQILAVINTDFAAYHRDTEYTTLPTHLCLPPRCYTAALNKYRASASDVTLMELIRRNNLYTRETGKELTIVQGYKLDTEGASVAGGIATTDGTNKGRIVYFNKDEDNLIMDVPMPLQYLSPQLAGVEVKVPGEFRWGPPHIRRTKTVKYRDGSNYL